MASPEKYRKKEACPTNCRIRSPNMPEKIRDDQPSSPKIYRNLHTIICYR